MPDEPPDETPPRPPLPTTPEEFKAAADWYRGRARFHSLMAEQARQMAETFERRAGLARAGTLPRVAREGTLGTMEAQQANAGSKVSAAKTKHPWPFSAALHAHGSSPAQWAKAQRPRQEPETVRSWLKAKGHGGRPVPRKWADAIEAEFAGTETPVPAIAASWPNGIRETP